MLQANKSKTYQTENKNEEIRYSRNLHNQIIELIDLFRSNSPSKEYTEILDDFREELTRYIDLSAIEALKRLRRQEHGEI